MDKMIRKDWGFIGLCIGLSIAAMVAVIPPGAARVEKGLVGGLVGLVLSVVLPRVLPENLSTMKKAVIVAAFFAVFTVAVYAV